MHTVLSIYHFVVGNIIPGISVGICSRKKRILNLDRQLPADKLISWMFGALFGKFWDVSEGKLRSTTSKCVW